MSANFAAFNRGHQLYSAGRPSRLHWPTFLALFHFCTVYNMWSIWCRYCNNLQNIIWWQTLEVYATTTSAGDTITSRITSNYRNPSCSAVYCNKITLQHRMLIFKISKYYSRFKSTCLVNQWLNYQCKFDSNFEHPNFTRHCNNAIRCGGDFCNHFIQYFRRNPTVTEFWNLVSSDKSLLGCFYDSQCTSEVKWVGFNVPLNTL